MRLSGNCFGKERLSGSGGSNKQNSLGDLGPQSRETLGIFEILDDFLDFLFDFIDSCHFVERNLIAVGAHKPRLGLPERRRPGPLCSPHEVHKKGDNQENRNQHHQRRRQPAFLRRCLKTHRNRDTGGACALLQPRNVRRLIQRKLNLGLRSVDERNHAQAVANDDFADLTVFDQGTKLCVVDLIESIGRAEPRLKSDQCNDDNECNQCDVPQILVSHIPLFVCLHAFTIPSS